jgi:hypothetical protein
MARPAASVVVDLDPGTDPIAVHALAPDQLPRAFIGWTGVFAALRGDRRQRDSRGSRRSQTAGLDSKQEEGL